jgi:hypothetical protein
MGNNVDLAIYIAMHAEGRDPYSLGREIEGQLGLCSGEKELLFVAIAAVRHHSPDREMADAVEGAVSNSEIVPQVQAVLDKPYDVIIEGRHVELGVVLPEKHAADFLAAFNQTFATKMAERYEGTKYLGASICVDPATGRVLVSVDGRYEGELYTFIEDFCAKRRPPLSFRKPGDGSTAWCL